MSEESNKPTIDKTSKMPMFMVAALMIVGLPVAFYGVNQKGLVAREPESTNAQSPPLPVSLPADESQCKALLARAEQLQKEQCNGCHSQSQTLYGPSYDEIVAAISVERPPSAGATASTDALSALAASVNHPDSGWQSYARGPRLNLPEKDRLALAYWIANNAKVTQ